MELDAANNNTRWLEGEQLELSQILDYNTFRDQGFAAPHPPVGHKKITVHFVYVF
jgi:hypothetical protein